VAFQLWYFESKSMVGTSGRIESITVANGDGLRLTKFTYGLKKERSPTGVANESQPK
jgi:hypothetical protein